MNCETVARMLNAALDEELNALERAEMDLHLSECESCRERWVDLRGLNNILKLALKPPSANLVIERVMERIASQFDGSVRSASRSQSSSAVRGSVSMPVGGPQRPTPLDDTDFAEGQSSSRGGHRIPAPLVGSRRQALGPMMLLVCTLAIVAGVVFQIPEATPAVAEMTMATGPIDIMRLNAREWTVVDGSSRIPLPAHARIRTREKSLCEIRTTSDALVRLNHETELVLHRSEQIELVSGELWCRTPAITGLEISTERISRQSSRETVFTCPSSSETQWQTTVDQELRCLAVSSSPVELKVNPPRANCTVQPGESLTFKAGSSPTEAGTSDPLRATSWQLPLLVLRNPQDRELRQRLTQLLANVGQSKISYLYEDQIRQLGPAGTRPLLAFVRSADSLQQPELRYAAMRIIADLAPASSRADLEHLLKDDDSVVRRFSQQALHRLQPGRLFEN